MILILVLVTTTLFSSHDISPIGNFLDFKTINSWVASSNKSFTTFDHVNKKFLQQLKQACPDSKVPIIDASSVLQDPVNRNGLFPGLILPLLKAVSKKRMREHGTGELMIVEIESGSGLRLWPLLYAVGGAALLLAQDSFGDAKDFESVVEEDPMVTRNGCFIIKKAFNQGCFALFETPAWGGAFDFFNAYNVMHLFNPIQHQNFLRLIDYLLKKSGKAFVSGLALNYRNSDGSTAKCAEQKKVPCKIYNAFMQMVIHQTYQLTNEGFEFLNGTVIATNEPGVNDNCGTQFLSEPLPLQGSMSYQVIQWVVNFMSLEILESAVNLCNKEWKTNLYIDRMYYVSPQGKPIKKEQKVPDNILFLMAVISKKRPDLKRKLN